MGEQQRPQHKLSTLSWQTHWWCRSTPMKVDWPQNSFGSGRQWVDGIRSPFLPLTCIWTPLAQNPVVCFFGDLNQRRSGQFAIEWRIALVPLNFFFAVFRPMLSFVEWTSNKVYYYSLYPSTPTDKCDFFIRNRLPFHTGCRGHLRQGNGK